MRVISIRTDWLRWCAALAVAALIAAGCGNDDDATAPRTVQQSSPTPTVETGDDQQPTPTVETGDDQQPTPTVETGDDQQPTPTVETPTDDGSSTGDDTETPSDAGGVPSDGAQPVPMPEDNDDFGPGVPQPRRADSDDTADYITKLMVWLGSVDVSPETGECYANAFLSTMEENRLEEVAETADTMQLGYGLPNNLLTEEEMSLFVDNSRQCIGKAAIDTLNTLVDGSWLLKSYSMDLLESIGLDPETFTATEPPDFDQLASECAELMDANATTHEMLIRVTFFEDISGEASDYMIQEVQDVCDESIWKAAENNVLTPLNAIEIASMFSLDYEKALCVAEAQGDVFSQMDFTSEDSEDPTDMDDMDPESFMAQWTEWFTECDIPLDRLLPDENRNESH